MNFLSDAVKGIFVLFIGGILWAAWYTCGWTKAGEVILLFLIWIFAFLAAGAVLLLLRYLFFGIFVTLPVAVVTCVWISIQSFFSLLFGRRHTQKFKMIPKK